MDNQIHALLSAGFEVDVLCMRRPGEPSLDIQGGLRIRRLPSLERKRGSQLRYMAEYGTFLVLCFLVLSLLQVKRSYQIVHVHTLPDFLVFVAAIPKLLGAKVVLDLRECTPEMYQSKYALPATSAIIRGLVAVEQASIRFAHVALTCTEQMRERFIVRGAAPDRLLVMLNTANEQIFRNPILPDPHAQSPEAFRIVTHGTVTKRYGHEVLVRAMAQLAAQAPEASLEIIGRGSEMDRLEAMVRSLDLEHCVTLSGYLPVDAMLRRLRAAHCGVVPILRTEETDLVLTYKMQEYIALGIPTVVTRTSAVEALYDRSCLLFFKSGDADGLAKALLRLRNNPSLRQQLAANALHRYRSYGSTVQQASYRALVERLTAPRTRSLPEATTGLSQE